MEKDENWYQKEIKRVEKMIDDREKEINECRIYLEELKKRLN